MIMTPQELRIERRRRAYGDGAPHRERNGTPTTSERIEQIRRANDIDEAIAAEHPGLFETLDSHGPGYETMTRRSYSGRRGGGNWITETLADGSIRQTDAAWIAANPLPGERPGTRGGGDGDQALQLRRRQLELERLRG
jgi:hypothetical protein